MAGAFPGSLGVVERDDAPEVGARRRHRARDAERIAVHGAELAAGPDHPGGPRLDVVERVRARWTDAIAHEMPGHLGLCLRHRRRLMQRMQPARVVQLGPARRLPCDEGGEQASRHHAAAQPPATETRGDIGVLGERVQRPDVGDLVRGPVVLRGPPVLDLGVAEAVPDPAAEPLETFGHVSVARGELLAGRDEQPPAVPVWGGPHGARVVLWREVAASWVLFGRNRRGDHQLPVRHQPREQQCAGRRPRCCRARRPPLASRWPPIASAHAATSQDRRRPARARQAQWRAMCAGP